MAHRCPLNWSHFLTLGVIVPTFDGPDFEQQCALVSEPKVLKAILSKFQPAFEMKMVEQQWALAPELQKIPRG